MSTALLFLFVVMLAVAFVAALRRPGLAVALGIATYGLEQIATIPVPFFAVHTSAFNILIALVLMASLGMQLLERIPAFATRDALDVTLLVWAFIALFCASVFWSPVLNPSKIWPEIPYFVVYVVAMPLLVCEPSEMLNGLRALWAILLVGLLGTLASPMFAFSMLVGRAVVATTGGDFDEGANPLAFADTAALLALTSTLLLFVRQGPWRRVHVIVLMAGIPVGVWAAVITARGEAVACLASMLVLAVLVRSRNLRRAARTAALTLAVSGALAVGVFVKFQDAIVRAVPRLAQGNLLVSMSIREDLQRQCFDAATAHATSTVIGLGGGGCQDLVGLYPHNEILQAFTETGLIGLVLMFIGYFFALRFGVRTLALAKAAELRDVVAIVAFFLSLLLYQILVANKKGVLTDPDSYMWLILSAMVFDRAQAAIRARAPHMLPAPTIGVLARGGRA